MQKHILNIILFIGLFPTLIFSFESNKINVNNAGSNTQGCVTFLLDMCGMPLNNGEAYFAASFQGWDPEPMCDMGGIWEISYCNIDPGGYEYKFLNGDDGWEFEAFGGPCTNPADNNNRFVDVNGGCEVEGPWCFNSCDPGSGSGPDDNSPPELVGSLPSDVTISCDEDLPDLEVIPAEDECSFNCTSELPEDDVSDLDECGLGIIVRTWRVYDCAGNEGEPHTQFITIQDAESPVFDERVDDITLSCNDPLPPKLRLEVEDNCDDDLTESDLPIDDVSGIDENGQGRIIRTWYVEDCSGNPSEITQTITVQGAITPVIFGGDLCENDSLYLTTTTYESYSWAFVDEFNNITDLNINNDSLLINMAGVYQLSVMDGPCEASVMDTIALFMQPTVSLLDTIVCNLSDDGNTIVNLLDLIDYNSTDSLVIIDGTVLENYTIDFDGEMLGSIEYQVMVFADGACPPFEGVINVNVLNCGCPELLPIDDICLDANFESLDLQSIQTFSEPGDWVLSPTSSEITIINDSLFISGTTLTGEFTLTYVFDDSELNNNCNNSTTPANVVMFNVVSNEIPVLAAGLIACNQDVGSVSPTVIDLDTLLLNNIEGQWSSQNNLAVVDAENIVDFNGMQVGVYDFEFTTIPSSVICNPVISQISIAVIDCACEPLAVITDTTLCTSFMEFDINEMLLVGDGNWSLQTSADSNAELSMNDVFLIESLSGGAYTFEFKLNNVSNGSACDSVALATVNLIAPPEVVLINNYEEICNGDNPQGLPFIFNLNNMVDLISGSGIFSSVDFPNAIPLDGLIDFTDVNAGVYNFTFTASLDTDELYCEDVSVDFIVEVKDCLCPESPMLLNLSFCNLDDTLDLNISNASIPTGEWSLFDNMGSEILLLDQEMIIISELSGGNYDLFYTVTDDDYPESCPDSIVSFGINVDTIPNVNIPMVLIVCDQETMQSSSIIDFTTIVTSVDGDWYPDVNFTNDFNDLSNVSFEGLGGNGYIFSFITNVVGSSCTNQEYTLDILVVDCSCPNVEILGVPDYCQGAVIELNTLLTENIVDGEFHLFDNNNNEININQMVIDTDDLEGNYTLQYIATNSVAGCPEMSEVEFEVFAIPKIGNARDLVICEDDLFEIRLFTQLDNTDSGGEWSQLEGDESGFSQENGIFIQEGLPPGDYVFQYTFVSGGICPEASIDLTITIVEIPNIELEDFAILDCENPFVRLGETVPFDPNLDYTWKTIEGQTVSTGSSTVDAREGGFYILTARDPFRVCQGSDTIEVLDLREEIDFSLFISNSDCDGTGAGVIEFSKLSGGVFDEYEITLEGEFETFTQSVSSEGFRFELLPDDKYEVIIKSGACTFDDLFININEIDIEALELEYEEIEVEVGQNFSVDVLNTNFEEFEIDSIYWYLNDEIVCEGNYSDCSEINLSVNGEEVLHVEILTIYGCLVEAQIQIFAKAEPNIYVPNVISFTGIDNNNILEVFSGDSFEILNYSIYDRWGNLIYQINGPVENSDANWWDGEHPNGEIIQGVYVLFLEYKLGIQSETLFQRTFDITLLR